MSLKYSDYYWRSPESVEATPDHGTEAVLTIIDNNALTYYEVSTSNMLTLEMSHQYQYEVQHVKIINKVAVGTVSQLSEGKWQLVSNTLLTPY